MEIQNINPKPVKRRRKHKRRSLRVKLLKRRAKAFARLQRLEKSRAISFTSVDPKFDNNTTSSDENEPSTPSSSPQNPKKAMKAVPKWKIIAEKGAKFAIRIFFLLTGWAVSDKIENDSNNDREYEDPSNLKNTLTTSLVLNPNDTTCSATLQDNDRDEMTVPSNDSADVSCCKETEQYPVTVPNELHPVSDLTDDPRRVFPKPSNNYLAHINGLCSATQSFFGSGLLEHRLQMIQELDELSLLLDPVESKSVSSDSSQPDMAMIDLFCAMRYILSNHGEKLDKEINELVHQDSDSESMNDTENLTNALQHGNLPNPSANKAKISSDPQQNNEPNQFDPSKNSTNLTDSSQQKPDQNQSPKAEKFKKFTLVDLGFVKPREPKEKKSKQSQNPSDGSEPLVKSGLKEKVKKIGGKIKNFFTFGSKKTKGDTGSATKVSADSHKSEDNFFTITKKTNRPNKNEKIFTYAPFDCTPPQEDKVEPEKVAGKKGRK